MNRIKLSIFLALFAICGFAQVPNPAIINVLGPNLPIPQWNIQVGPPFFYAMTAGTSAATPLKMVPVVLDPSVRFALQPDGSIKIVAVPVPPPPPAVLPITDVEWARFSPATGTTTAGLQTWCAATGQTLPANWTPVMVTEVQLTVNTIMDTTTPTASNYLFSAYLIQSPSAAATSPTPQGMTWTRSSPACNNGGAVSYAPEALLPGDTRAQLWVMIASQ